MLRLLALEEGKETEQPQGKGEDVRGKTAVVVKIQTFTAGGSVDGYVLSDQEYGII